VAIVVDDGLATGATMIAALHALRARRPSRLICAVPVASREAVVKVRRRGRRRSSTHRRVSAAGSSTDRQVDAEVIAHLRAAARADRRLNGRPALDAAPWVCF
jgi:predicted phosphoribosyltransferase